MPVVGLAIETDIAFSISKLELAPEIQGYILTDGASYETRDLRGGLPRARRDKIGTSAMCDLQWVLSADEYDLLKVFYEQYISSVFRMDLYVDQYTLTEHFVKFVPGNFRLNRQQGAVYYVGAKLEVFLIKPAQDYDLGLIAIFGAYQEGSQALIDALAIFANTTLETYL